MINPQNITGIILAGGQSSRMGQDKAFVKWRDKFLIDHVIEALLPICSEIIISSNTLGDSYKEMKVVADRYTGIGPIAGIEAGLRFASHSMTIIASCDTPLLPTLMFQYLLDQHGDFEISLAAHDGVNEPMIGVFSKNVHQHFHHCIEEGNYKPPQVIKQRKWQEIDIHPGLGFYSEDMFRNLNSPNDLIDKF